MSLPFLPLAALLAGPSPQGPAAEPPPWVQALPETPGRLYALGAADLGAKEGQALAQASDRARLAVVSRLRATVKGQTAQATRTTETLRDGQRLAGAGERQVRDEVSVTARAEDLPGLVVERTFVDLRGGTAYALAYLDLAQARAALAGRLAGIREARGRAGKEISWKTRWRLRRVLADLGRLEDALALLAPAGAGGELGPGVRDLRESLEKDLADLGKVALPAPTLAGVAVAFRCNVDLPPGVAAYLESRIAACGAVHRELDPDLALELSFAGGAQGPEFLFPDMDVYGGLSYRLEAQLGLVDPGGAPVARAVPIQLAQGRTPEGLVERFRRKFERELPRLFAQFLAQCR
jgi:hypothetical protein